MRNTIYIRFDRNWPDELLWLRVDENGPGVPETGAAQALAAIHGYRLVVLAPAESVLLARVSIPARNRQRVIQALPYMLEDRLVQDIELLHFAIGSREADGALNVAIVERARLDGWLERLRVAGIEPDAIVPETLAVPFEPGAWTVLVDGDVTIVRTGAQAGFAIDTENLPALLGHALEDAGEARPERLVIYAGADAIDTDWFAGFGIETLMRSLDEDPLILIAQNVDERATIDLLQGEYNRSEEFSRLYRPWIASAAALAVLLVLYTGMLVHDYVGLSHEADRLQQSIEQTYREAFPEAARVVNPRVQMERGLDSLRRGGGADAGGFLDMMRDAAPTLKQIDGIALQRVNYRDRRLDLALTIRDLQHLDSLKQQLGSGSGLEVDIQSASAAGERVEARIQLRASP